MLLELVGALALAQPEGDGFPARLDDYQFAQVQQTWLSDGPTRVSVETNAPAPRACSFPVRVFVDNTRGPAGPLQLSLRGSVQGAHTVERQVELRAGERRVVTLPTPADLRYGVLTARGAGVRDTEAQVSFNVGNADGRVVLSIGKAEDYERLVDAAPRYEGTPSVQVLPMPASEVPVELAALCGYDAVVLPGASALEGLDEAQRRALEAYAATGGTLVLRPPVTPGPGLPLLASGSPGAHAYGLGQVWLAGEGAPAVDHELSVSPQVPRVPATGPGAALLPQASAPLGRFLLLIGAFALAIGPGSVWVARRRGPPMLLLTIPGTALFTCLAIVGSSVLGDGFTAHSSALGMTLLDSRHHRAVTAGVTAYYANLAPASASYPSMTALVAPHDEQFEHFAADFTWRDGLTLGTDFLPSRTYREWGFLSVEPTRARVLVRRRGEGAVLQNALGHRIERVQLTLDGQWWHAGPVADGAEVPLVRGTTELVLGHPERFGEAVRAALDRELADGEFHAVLTGVGFVPTGGLTTTPSAGEHHVRGEFER